MTCGIERTLSRIPFRKVIRDGKPSARMPLVDSRLDYPNTPTCILSSGSDQPWLVYAIAWLAILELLLRFECIKLSFFFLHSSSPRYTQ